MFIVNIKSGFGNQLFQYNFAKYLQDKYPNEKIVFNTTVFKKDSIHGGYMLGNVPFKINNHLAKNTKTVVTDETFENFQYEKGNVFFDGYWQNLKFFDKQYLFYDDIFEKNINDNNTTWLDKIKTTNNSVSIHVRCGDYNNHFLMGNIATKSYFNTAINEILKDITNPEFFIFSDDIEWAKKNLDFKGNKVNFITGNEKPQDNKWDIFLMSHCKYNILSNSSFSWWSHYLNSYKEKKAIIPQYWINDIADSFPTVKSSLQELETLKEVINIPEVSIANENPMFSIVLTAYNQENCLRRAISSVLNQSYQDFELIIVDDCSNDGTYNLINSYATLNKQVKIFRHNINSSSHAARMTGVKNAKGKYLLFLDGDDFFFIDALEKLKNEVIDKNDFDVCEFSYALRPKDEIITPQPWDNSKQRIYYYGSDNSIVNVWNKLYKTEIVKKAFSVMKDGYIRTGDDTYESICISYFTEKYIQTNIPILNYLVADGISFRLNTLKSNTVHAKSLNLALSYLKDFMVNTNNPNLITLYANVEEHCYNWFASVIKYNTVEEDVVKSLQLLPQYFDFRFFESYLSKIYAPVAFKKKIKKTVKRILPAGLKQFIKKILKR